jgi:probable phosphoglycerate mutase
VAQAARAARLLAALEPTAIVSSDLRRAADTAAALASVTGLSVAYDEGLRETNGGRWQGLTGAEIAAQFGDEQAAWKRGDVDARPLGGESRDEVASRLVAAVRRALTSVGEGGTLVVVTHGGAARVGICKLMGLPASTWRSLGVLSNCCWSVLTEGAAGWRLVEHNAGTLPQPVLSEEG